MGWPDNKHFFNMKIQNIIKKHSLMVNFKKFSHLSRAKLSECKGRGFIRGPEKMAEEFLLLRN